MPRVGPNSVEEVRVAGEPALYVRGAWTSYGRDGQPFWDPSAGPALFFERGDRMIMVNGAPAPLLFASDSEINIQCPLLPPGSPLEVTVETENGASASLGQSVMRPVMPSLFTVGNGNQGVVMIGATNDIAMPKTNDFPSRPARKGEFVTIYASGLGEAADGVPIGTPAPLDRLVLLKNKVSVVVGGVEIEPAFAGLAPAANTVPSAA